MMREAIDMLRRLAPPIRATAVGRSRRPVFEDRGFADLLAGAAIGEVASDQPLRDKRDEPDDLATEDMVRLNSAADRAAARGYDTAMMLIDGRGLIVDVTNRTVVGELNSDDENDSIDLDGAIFVASEVQASGPVTLDPIANPIPFAVAREIQQHRSETTSTSIDPPQPRSTAG